MSIPEPSIVLHGAVNPTVAQMPMAKTGHGRVGQLIWYLVVRTGHAVRWQIMVQRKDSLLHEAPAIATT